MANRRASEHQLEKEKKASVLQSQGRACYLSLSRSLRQVARDSRLKEQPLVVPHISSVKYENGRWQRPGPVGSRARTTELTRSRRATKVPVVLSPTLGEQPCGGS